MYCSNTQYVPYPSTCTVQYDNTGSDNHEFSNEWNQEDACELHSTLKQKKLFAFWLILLFGTLIWETELMWRKVYLVPIADVFFISAVGNYVEYTFTKNPLIDSVFLIRYFTPLESK